MRIPRAQLALPATLALALAVAGCSSRVRPPTTPAPAARGFRMGFSPAPAAFGAASQDEAFAFCGAHGDIVLNHHDLAVPWDSALAGRPPRADIVADFTLRRTREQALGLHLFVAVNCLTAFRDSIAPGWGGAPRPPEIQADPTFANPAARRAWKYWCAWVATFYQPDAFAAGVEINTYQHGNPADWPNLVSLYRGVYDTLKTLRPQMQVFPTFQLDNLHKWNQWSVVPPFEDKMDAMTLSVYPGASFVGGAFLTPATIPADYLAKARTATGTARPLMISETGFGDSTLTPPGWPGTPQMERDYVKWLMRQADSLGVRQIIWFFPSDQWAFIDILPPPLRQILSLFGPMGLRKRDLASKPALAEWDANFARPYAP